MELIIIIVIAIVLIASSASRRKRQQQAKEAEEKRRQEAIARAQQAAAEGKEAKVAAPPKVAADPRFPDWEPPIAKQPIQKPQVVTPPVKKTADPRFPDWEPPVGKPEDCDVHTPLPRPGSIDRAAVRPEGPDPRQRMVAARETVNEHLVAAGSNKQISPKNHVATPSVRTPFAPPPKHPEEKIKKEDTPKVGFVPKFSGNAIVQGVIYSEILAKPKALRRG